MDHFERGMEKTIPKKLIGKKDMSMLFVFNSATIKVTNTIYITKSLLKIRMVSK